MPCWFIFLRILSLYKLGQKVRLSITFVFFDLNCWVLVSCPLAWFAAFRFLKAFLFLLFSLLSLLFLFICFKTRFFLWLILVLFFFPFFLFLFFLSIIVVFTFRGIFNTKFLGYKFVFCFFELFSFFFVFFVNKRDEQERIDILSEAKLCPDPQWPVTNGSFSFHIRFTCLIGVVRSHITFTIFIWSLLFNQRLLVRRPCCSSFQHPILFSLFFLLFLSV